MLLTLEQILNPDEVRQFREHLDGASWEDGAKTAGSLARHAKQNQQLGAQDALAVSLGQHVLRRLAETPQFIAAALPRRIYPPKFNRYADGGTYGAHIDASVMAIPGTGDSLRTDLSATLFLSEPEEYDGGELEIEGGRIRIHLEDLGARFNLDRLRNPNDELNRARYQRLLAQLGLPPHDPASLPTTAGYNHKPLPFADSSELRRLVALDFSGWQRLQPWVTTTGLTALNINTASAQLLATLESLDLGIAQALVQQRPADGYKSVQEFLEQPLLQGRQVNGAGLTTSSSNFRATLEVALGERRLHLISDLRTGIDGQVQVLRRQLVAPLRTFSE